MNKIPSLRHSRFRDDQDGQRDRREEILRQEMNNIATRGHRHFQWAVTLLLSLGTALFFVRKEAAERAGFAPGEPFPLHRHLWGTVMIAIITSILIVIARAIYSSYEYYANQLRSMLPADIKPAPQRRVKSLIWLTLLIFPLFDLFIGVANSVSPLRHDPSFAPAAGASVTTRRSPEPQYESVAED
jgi:hypothetical protein